MVPSNGLLIDVRWEWDGTDTTEDVEAGVSSLPIADSLTLATTTVVWVGETGPYTVQSVTQDNDGEPGGPGVITLASTLTEAADAGTPVIPDVGGQPGRYWVAEVILPDTDQPIEVPLTAHDLAVMPEGGYDPPRAIIISDDQESVVNLPGDPIISGDWIPGDTLPSESDGEPPDYSPAVAAAGGQGIIHLAWAEVPNPDQIWYEVHMSISPGFVPVAGDPGTLVLTTLGTSATVARVPYPSGVPNVDDPLALVPGTEYFFRIIAIDPDGAAPPGPEGSAETMPGIDYADAVHIVSEEDPGLPAAESVPVSGAMRDPNSWYFLSPDDATWNREPQESGDGMRVWQGTGAVWARNLITTPSFEGGVVGDWTSQRATLAAVSSDAWVGESCLKVTWPEPVVGEDGESILPSSVVIPVQVPANTTMVLQARVLVPAGSPDVQLEMSFEGATEPVTMRDVWTLVETTVDSGSLPSTETVALVCPEPVAGTVCYLDAVMLRSGQQATDPAGDAPTDPGIVYAWTGVAHESTSTMQVGGVTITNLATNPSYEVDPTGLLVEGGTIELSQEEEAYSGLQAVVLTADTDAPSLLLGEVPVDAGLPYTAQAHVQGQDVQDETSPTTATLEFEWVGGTVVDPTRSGLMPYEAGDWAEVDITGIAPPGATSARVWLRITDAVPGSQAAVDGWMVTEGETVVPYFDGDSPDVPVTFDYFDGDTQDTAAFTYAWEGTPYRSTSVTLVGESSVVDQAVMWSDAVFTVEPGDVLDLEMVAQWLAGQVGTISMVICYGSDEAIDPWPDGETTQVVTYLPSVVVAGSEPVTLDVEAVVPDGLDTAAEVGVPPARARLGLLFNAELSPATVTWDSVPETVTWDTAPGTWNG